MTQVLIEHQAYDTHLNYIKCLSELVKGAGLKYTGALKKGSILGIDEKKYVDLANVRIKAYTK